MRKYFRAHLLFILCISVNLLFAQSPAFQVPEMVYVKGGSFEMGSNTGTKDEMPQHEVTVYDFSIGKYEVTRAEFRQFQNATGFKTQAEKTETEYHKKGDIIRDKPITVNQGSGLDPVKIYADSLYPMAGVSWYSAQAYCDWLSKVTGQQYRLPTAAEWEYAARGGANSKNYAYSGSNEPDEVAWYVLNSQNQSHVGGKRRPNELGIYDMSGNQEEWCSDWYNKFYYSESPKLNPAGSDTGKQKVLRGGSWSSRKLTLRVTFRNNDVPEASHVDYGFRVVRSEMPTPVELATALESSPLKKEMDSLGTIQLDGIVFKSGSAQLVILSEQTIFELASYLNEDKDACILIEGHTDNTGKKAINLSLSEKRAIALRLQLFEHGISADRIQVKGFGDTISVADNNTTEGRKKNRRVSILKIPCSQ